MNEQLRKEVMIIEELFQIADKAGKDVPMKLNTAQRILVSSMTGRDLVPKARQEGVSSLVLALFTVRCLYKRNTRAVVISHDRESTERLFKRVKYYLENFKGPPPVLEFASKREFTFPKTNSMFYVGTAGARKFGRGDTITDLHCSEYAFWENPIDLFSGLTDAVPLPHVGESNIIIESTGNGKNDYFKKVMDAVDGRSPYEVHFLPWHTFPEYDLPMSEEEAREILSSLDSDLEEDKLVEEYGLTAGQIKFRRYKLAEKDWNVDLFKQEYPMYLDECFRATGRSLFHKVNYQPTDKWTKIGPYLHGLPDHPAPQYNYSIGCDPAAGVGADNSVLEVVCLETQEQVAEWVYDRLGPDELGLKAAQLGRMYNDAFITVERNNHGIVTLKTLRDNYPIRLIYRDAFGRDMLMTSGFATSGRIKKEWAIGLLRTLLVEELIIHSPTLKSELDTFVEKEDGKLEAEDGYNDDRVMALTMCCIGIGKAIRAKLQPEPVQPVGRMPFTLDSIIDELRARGKKFPIPPQHRLGMN